VVRPRGAPRHDEATRLATLKRGEVDVTCSIRGALAEELKRTAGLRLAPTLLPATFWIDFTTEQWNPKSPWHDRRVRQAASPAIDRQALNLAETLGFSKSASSIIPSSYEDYWGPPPIPYDPAQAKRLLAEAGFPQGFDAGDFACDTSYTNVAAAANYLKAVGIQTRVRPIERVAFLRQWREKKIRGTYVYRTYPEIDDLFAQQAREVDRKKREALLHQIQRVAHDRVMFAPIWELAFLNGVGPRVGEAGLGLIEHHPYSSPYEDLKLKGR
jgi:peptide/nickel transport system substrate-binding protein